MVHGAVIVLEGDGLPRAAGAGLGENAVFPAEPVMAIVTLALVVDRCSASWWAPARAWWAEYAAPSAATTDRPQRRRRQKMAMIA
jgi:hypothetical protein